MGATSLNPAGPQIGDLLSQANSFLIGALCLASALAVLTTIVYIFHFRQLRQLVGDVRTWTVTIISMAPIFAWSALAALFFPRVNALFVLLRAFSEALAIHSYVSLLVQKMGGVDGVVKTIVSVKPQTGPYMATLPFCCFCKPCCFHVRVDRRYVERCMLMARQLMYVVPINAFLSLWLELERDTCTERDPDAWDVYDTLEIILGFLNFGCVMIAMWGLMQIFLSTKEQLSAFLPGRKLLAVKLIIFFGMIQNLVVGLLISQTLHDDRLFNKDTAINGWKNWLLCMESLPLAYLFWISYPPLSSEYTPINNEKAQSYGTTSYIAATDC